MLEILHILAEQDYNIELTAADYDHFEFFSGRTFATAAQLQEFLFARVLEQTSIRARETSDYSRHSTYIRTHIIDKCIKVMRKCVPDVDVDQFSPKQRRLYVFYGQG
jgi:hypothetical protein